MPTLLVEIGCEELPAWACTEGAAQLPELCERHLGRRPDELYAGPRRLAVILRELEERTPDEWVKGPPEALAERAAEGFARRHGVAVAELEPRDGFLGVTIPGRPLAQVLPERLEQVVRGFAFSRTMRWDESGLRFPRPVRWICALLDDEAVEVGVVPSGQVTYGHRFTHGRVEIPSASRYAETLREEGGVEPDRAERFRQITEGLDALGGWSDPAGVLDEVVHLVESPIVLEGRFGERFLQLPERVIVTTMQSHQRYFPLGGNRFAFVANGGDPDVVRAGNEAVLESRLDDASFTFERDVQRGIDALAEALPAITFFAGAGTFADKTERIARIVDRLGGGDASREAARLAKADQASELVREFPDLEGAIGAEYARLAGYPEAVCAAIEEQYLPDSAGGPLPETEAGKVLAAADKIDTLTVAFELGHRPTGSRDPFGLRRAAIGLARLALEGGLRIPRALLEPEVRDFVEERLEGLLDVPVEFVRAARASDVPELGQVAELARVLASLPDERLDRLHTVFTRAHRIVAKADEEELPELRSELLHDEAEVAVARALSDFEAGAAAASDFDAAVAAAEELAAPLERFFEDVLVMADDRELRRNRLRLLADVRDAVSSRLGDLAQIPR
ncbi:MAG TPA: glycine--tRNA ligase subunit beta [Gaiellaceae bacterium]